jgi:hypothetical protein
MSFSAKDAAQYAIDCNIDTNIHGMTAQEYVDKCNGTVKVNVVEETAVEITKTEEVKYETTETTETNAELSKEVLVELLKANNIKFHPSTGVEKLMILAKENGLLE